MKLSDKIKHAAKELEQAVTHFVHCKHHGMATDAAQQSLTEKQNALHAVAEEADHKEEK